MTAPCFVDADILVYARDPRDPLKQQRAAEWLDWSVAYYRQNGRPVLEGYALKDRAIVHFAEDQLPDRSGVFAHPGTIAPARNLWGQLRQPCEELPRQCHCVHEPGMIDG